MLDSTFTRAIHGRWFASLVGGVSNFDDFKSTAMRFMARQISTSHGVSDEVVEVMVPDSKLLQPGVCCAEEGDNPLMISCPGVGP